MTPMQWPTSAQQLCLFSFANQRHMYKEDFSILFVAVHNNNFCNFLIDVPLPIVPSKLKKSISVYLSLSVPI